MGSPGIADYTTGVIWQYIGGGIDTQKTVWICPSDITARDQLRSGGSASPVERNFSYSFNGRMAHDHFSTQATNGPTPIKTTDVKKATQKIMIIEEYGPNDTWNIMPGVDDQPSGRHGTNSSTGFQSLGFYQTGKGNYVFFDGHVESIGVSDILDPKNLEWYLNLEIPSQN
jgi:prepilin-type processing-associated H-X9-DG protein